MGQGCASALAHRPRCKKETRAGDQAFALQLPLAEIGSGNADWNVGLGGSSQILAQHPWVPGSDAQQSKGWPLRTPSTLFPIAKRMNADAQRLGELFLGQAGKPAKRRDVFFWIDLAADDAFPLPARNRPREILIRQLTNLVTH